MSDKLGDVDFEAFTNRYRALRLGSMDFEFVILWRSKLERFALDVLIAAVDDLTADSRAGFPLNDLPILIEHAEANEDRRKPGWKDPLAGEQPPKLSSAWNRFMVEHGVITKKEFAKREKERAI